MTSEASELWLLVRASGQLCALPLEHVDETMRPQPVRTVAGVAPFVRGVAVIRGVPVPVVDAASALGQAAASSTTKRFVALKTGERRLALAVDEVVDVRRIAPGLLANVPPLLAAASEQVLAAIGTLDSELLMVLRSGKLVPDATWAAIAAEGSR